MCSAGRGTDPAPARHLILPEVRTLIYTDLDRAVCHILEQTIVHLNNKGMAIEEHTLEACDFYRKKIKRRRKQD